MDKKLLITMMAILLVIGSIITYELFTILSPIFITTTSEYHYSHESAEQLEIELLCNTVHDCSIKVVNSTGELINVSIWTTAPKTAEYKGSQKVAEAIRRDVKFTGDYNNLTLTILLMGGDVLFSLAPTTASVEVQIPKGTNYTLTKVWPY